MMQLEAPTIREDFRAEFVKCPRCGSEAIWNPSKAKYGKQYSGYECETCTKIDRVKRMTCSHTGAHFEGNKWTCQQCAEYKEHYRFNVEPYLSGAEAISSLSRTVLKLRQLLDNSDKLNKVLQVLSHECDENCVILEDQETGENLQPGESECRMVLDAKAHFAKWYEDYRKLAQIEGVEITITPSMIWSETCKRGVWSIRTAHTEEDYNGRGYKRNSENRKIGEHIEVRERQKYHRKDKYWETVKEDVPIGDWADCWNEEGAKNDHEIGFLQENEDTIIPSGLNLVVKLSAQIVHSMKITFTKSIQVQENYQFGQIVKPIIESLINPSEANPEEIFNRAKQIYLEEAAKREEPIIEPEPEELEESGALDQAKEELNQEQERGTTFSEDIASEQETTQLSATKLQCGCEFHRGYRDRQARFKENLMKSRNCEGCGRKYNPLDVYACSTIFCSKECGDKAWAKAEGKRLEAENQAKSVPNPAETPERNIIKLKENCSKCNRYKTQKGLYHHLINKHGFDAKTAYDKANEILEAKPASEEVAEEKWDQVLEEKFDFLVTCEYCGHQWLDSCVVMALEHECKYEQERNQARELNNAKSIVEPIIQKTPKELIVVVEATPYAQSFILDREPIEEEPTKELVVIVEPNPQSFIMDQEPAEETLDETPILYQVPAILTRATETLHWLVSNLRL